MVNLPGLPNQPNQLPQFPNLDTFIDGVQEAILEVDDIPKPPSPLLIGNFFIGTLNRVAQSMGLPAVLPEMPPLPPIPPRPNGLPKVPQVPKKSQPLRLPL